jgi:hypothetical protein
MENPQEEPGYRRIGSRLPSFASSPSATGSTPTTLPPSSATSGAQSLARADSNSTGLPPSATGAERLPSVRQAMERPDPEATDRAIVACLPRSIGSTLCPVYQDRIDPVYGFDTELVGYATMSGERPSADLMDARQLVGRYLVSAPEARIKAELARLRVSTKARPEGEDDLAMMFQVFAEECAEYPADVMVWALRGWARREIFYPSLAELRDLLQRGARRRRSLMEALSPAMAA